MVCQSISDLSQYATYIPLYACVVYHLIDVVGGYAGSNLGCGQIEDFSRESTNFSHTVLLFLVEDPDLVAVDRDPLGPRKAVPGIIWTLYAIWELPSRRKRVHRSKGSGEVVRREGVV